MTEEALGAFTLFLYTWLVLPMAVVLTLAILYRYVERRFYVRRCKNCAQAVYHRGMGWKEHQKECWF